MKKDKNIVRKNIRAWQAVDIHLKLFGHLPNECGGSDIKCPWKKSKGVLK